MGPSSPNYLGHWEHTTCSSIPPPFRLYHYTSQKMSRGTPCSSTYTHTTMPTNAPYCSFHPCSTSTCNVSHSGPVVWPEYPPFLSPNLDQRVFSTRATVPNSQGINHSIGFLPTPFSFLSPLSTFRCVMPRQPTFPFGQHQEIRSGVG